MASSTIRSHYRFYLTHSLWGTVEAFPAVNNLKWDYTKDQGLIFHRKFLKTQLKFINDAPKEIDDFTRLYEVERSVFKCEGVAIEVEKKCGDTWHPFFRGTLSMIDADWDVSNCEVTVEPRPTDKYDCLLSGWDSIVDVASIPTVDINQVADLEGVIFQFQEATCSGNVTVDFQEYNQGIVDPNDLIPSLCELPAGGFWEFDHNDWQIIDQSGQNITFFVTAYFTRAVGVGTCEGGAPVPPAGSGWNLLEDNCPTNSLWVGGLGGVLGDYSNFFNNFSFKHGRKLSDILTYLVSECGLTVVSDFYNINPDDTHPENYAYQNAEKWCQEITLHHITDITDPRASDPAPRWEIKLKELLEDLDILHNVKWFIDDNEQFRLEHISYFSGSRMMNLTTEENRKYIVGSFKYKYNDYEIPKTETWKAIVEGGGADFLGQPIEYSGYCSNAKEFKHVEYATKILYADVTRAYYSPGQMPDEEHKYVILSTKNYSAINLTFGLLSNQPWLNACFSWANLMDYFHQYDRPHYTGKLNGEQKNFFSVKYVRTQEKITIPMCCADTISFDADILVKTQLGWGQISTATLDDPGNKLTIETIHKP